MGVPNLILAGVSLVGGLMKSDADRAEGQAKQSYYNDLADVSMKDSQKVTVQQGRDISALQGKLRAYTAAQKVATAQSGLWGGGTTVQDVAKSTQVQGDIDEEAIRYNAEEKRKKLYDEAFQYRKAGANARDAGERAAFGSLLGGVTGAATAFIK